MTNAATDGLVLSNLLSSRSEIEAAEVLPHGGLVHVDLLDPTGYLSLHLTPQLVTADDHGRAYLAAYEAGAEPGVPAVWTRLAFTAGVDRWSTLPLVEGLLAADRAAAFVDAGMADRGREFYDVARADLTSLVGEVAGRSRMTGALPDELRRVVGRGVLCGALDRRFEASIARSGTGPSRLLGDGPFAVAEDDEVPRSTRRAAVPRGMRGVRGSGADQITAFIDPRRMPARLCEELRIEVSLSDNDVVHVRVPAFGGVEGDHPGVRRLFAAATAGDAVISGGPVDLANDRAFAARFSVDRSLAPEATVLVEVFDCWSPVPVKSALDRANSAKTVRRMLESWVAGRVEQSQGVAPEPAVDSVRPLLAEFVAVSSWVELSRGR